MGSDYMTMAEIEAKYPDEWVIIDRPKSRRGQSGVKGGYVFFHTSNRDELDRQLNALPAEVSDIAVFYLGKPDPNEVWMLKS